MDKSAMRRFAFWGSATLSTSTHRHYDESVHRIKQHTRGNNTIPYHRDFSLVTFEMRRQRAHCYTAQRVKRYGHTVNIRLTDNTIIKTSCTINAFISKFRLQRIILHYRSLPAPLLKPRYKRKFGSNSLLCTAFKTV